MFVLSTQHARALLQLGPDDRLPLLLDVGAGDGGVTERLEPLFDRVVATEASQWMVGRLRDRGFRALHRTTLDGIVADMDGQRPSVVA